MKIAYFMQPGGQLALIEQIMNGTAPEGRLDAFEFKRSALGFLPDTDPGFIPVLQRGTAECWTATCPHPGAAFLVQAKPAGEPNDRLRLWGFFPPSGDPYAMPTFSKANIASASAPKIGTVKKAVLQGSKLHFVSFVGTSLLYGVAKVRMGVAST